MTPNTTTSPFSRSLRMAVALACALIAVFSAYVYSEKQIDQANARRYQSRLLAAELRQTSDDLTRMVRTYVLTGNPVYKQHYLEILDIRDGRKPRPVNYDGIYWDLATPDGKPPAPNGGAKVALLVVMQQAGFTEDEFRRLAQAKADSETLTAIEFAAMALFESAAPNLEARRLRASQMLHDDDYHQFKADIMRPIKDFLESVDRRTLLGVQESRTNATLLRIGFVLLGFGLLLSLWRTFKTLHGTLGGPVDEVHGQITRIGQGNFTDAICLAPGMDNSVLGWLAQTQRQLNDIERARQVSDAKLKRLAGLYAALSDCNHAIVRCVTEQELFEQICRAAVEHGGATMAWIGLMDPQDRRIMPTVSYGVGVECLSDIHIAMDAEDASGQGPVSDSMRRDQPFWCQDYLNDPVTALWHPLALRFGWAASAALPLHRDGVVAGAFNVHFGVVNAFDEPAQKLMLEMASDIDHALKNFDREAARELGLAQRVRTQQLDALRSFMLERLTSDLPLEQVLRDFVLKIEDTMPGALCSILLLDAEGQRLVSGAAPHLPDFYNAAIDGVAIGPQTGSCGTAAFTGQRVIVGDIATHPYWADYKDLAQRAGLASCWSEPIRSGSNKVLGTFATYHRAPVMPQADELELIEMAAHLTAIAIERKRAEMQLQLVAKVFEQGSESIVITDSQGRIVRVNHAFSQITGYSEAEALGRNPSMLASGRHEADFFRAMWESIHAHGQWQGEIWNRRKDGTHYPELLSISLQRDSSGAVANYVAVATDISKHKKDEERIRLLVDFDPLTGLPNRRLLRDRVASALSHAQRQGEPLVLMFLDLDRFKNVNDSLGHHTGDELLIQVAQRLRSVLREQDTVCRLGGDEFVLLCPDLDATGAAHVASKVLEITSQRYLIDQQELAITFSIGIALYPTDGDSFETLSTSADTAMHRAKQAGRNAYRFFTPEMQTQSSRTLQLENGLRRALELQQLHLVYQPQVSLHDDRVIGMEALLRWQHPALGTVSPAEFIPIAEDSGLILPIGEWVLRTATRQMRVWLDAGLPVQQMAVNLSAVQFRQESLLDLVKQVLAETGLPPHYLELELTEGVAMNDPLGAMAVMNNLHQLGVRMSIDDFGTGYSSLNYLKRFSVYKLKIDQSFVRDITDDSDDKAIVVAIIALARSLGFQTIAEGVETQGQLAFLREQGCDEVQGYFFSEPLPAERFEAFVRQYAARTEGDSWSGSLVI
ncbi:MAG: EAL domain-containing protein [Rhodoferax sp.]|nr:EAL domain-containing protein [Rhodoferax sp.]